MACQQRRASGTNQSTLIRKCVENQQDLNRTAQESHAQVFPQIPFQPNGVRTLPVSRPVDDWFCSLFSLSHRLFAGPERLPLGHDLPGSGFRGHRKLSPDGLPRPAFLAFPQGDDHLRPWKRAADPLLLPGCRGAPECAAALDRHLPHHLLSSLRCVGSSCRRALDGPPQPRVRVGEPRPWAGVRLARRSRGLAAEMAVQPEVGAAVAHPDEPLEHRPDGDHLPRRAPVRSHGTHRGRRD